MPVLRPSGSDFTSFVKAAAQYVPAGGGAKVSKSGGVSVARPGLGAVVRTSQVGALASPTTSAVVINGITPPASSGRAPVAGGGLPFVPTSISGCGIWLDGADISATSMTFSSGSNLSVWKDKSGSANNFSLTSGITTSIVDGAYKAVSIGSSGIMTSANQITFTTSSAFFTVSKVTTTSSYPATSIAFPNITGGDYSIRFQLGLLDGTPPRSGNDNDLAAYKYYVNGSFNPNYDSTYYYNVYCIVGTVAPTTPGTSYVTVSSAFGSPARGFIGNIAEFIYYPAGLTDTQRQQVEGYLAWKWGLQSTLPAGHLYKSAAPV